MVQACLESSLAIVIGVEIRLYTKSRSRTRDVEPRWLAQQTAAVSWLVRSININKIATGQQRYKEGETGRDRCQFAWLVVSFFFLFLYRAFLVGSISCNYSNTCDGFFYEYMYFMRVA